MQHGRTKWVWTDGFSSGVWKWECFCTVESQQVESSRWMEQQQKKRDGPVRCVCKERRASEHRKRAQPEVVHGSVPARWDTLEWLWSAPCESVQPIYRWPAASPEASVASEAAAWRRCDPGSGRRLWPGCSGRAVAYRKSPPVRHSTVHCSSPSHLGPPRCIKCNSPSINGQCTNHRIAVRCSEILMCPLKG